MAGNVLMPTGTCPNGGSFQGSPIPAAGFGVRADWGRDGGL